MGRKKRGTGVVLVPFIDHWRIIKSLCIAAAELPYSSLSSNEKYYLVVKRAVVGNTSTLQWFTDVYALAQSSIAWARTHTRKILNAQSSKQRSS